MSDKHNINSTNQPLSQLISLLVSAEKKSAIIAICGAGGKTSLMYRLGHLLAEQGRKVLLTTTTKIYRPNLTDDLSECCSQLVSATSDQQLQQQLSDNFSNQNDKTNGGNLIIAALEPAKGSKAQLYNKLCGISPELPSQLIAQQLFDIVIVEADGAARKPLKAPSDQEPVIPTGTDLVIGVSGWEGLSQPVSQQKIHRLETFCQLTGLATGDHINPDALEPLILNPAGLFKNRPPKAQCCWLINQADDDRQQQQAITMAKLVANRAKSSGAKWLSAILTGSLQRDQFTVI